MSDDITPAPQRKVLEYYQEGGGDAVSVGDYVRVEGFGRAKLCFGPTDRVAELHWHVVEIDWDHRSVLLAPIKPRSLEE